MFSEISIRGFIQPNLNGTNIFSKDNKGFLENIKSFFPYNQDKGIPNIKKVDLSDTGLKEIFGESCLEPSNNRDMIKKISDWSYKILKSLEDTEKNKV
jgi:hypothetical protein